VDLALLRGPWVLDPMRRTFAVGLPLAQLSLVALWAAFGRGPSYARFALALVGLAWTWLVVVGLLQFGVRADYAAGWGAALAVQGLMVFAAASAGRVAWRYATAPRGSDSRWSPLQFGVGWLLLWTAVIAAVLGLGQTVTSGLGWTEKTLSWEYFPMAPAIGGYNAAYALLVMGALAARGKPSLRAAAAAGLVGLACSQSAVLARLFGSSADITPTVALLLAGSQVVWLSATLLPVWIASRPVEERTPERRSSQRSAGG
jgi:uncharacterized membrane protein YuzA (DUF378 family)